MRPQPPRFAPLTSPVGEHCDYPGFCVLIRGYFLWSLMDNFNWIFGLEKRFGLHRVDFQSQARVPNLSAAFYRDAAARNASAV